MMVLTLMTNQLVYIGVNVENAPLPTEIIVLLVAFGLLLIVICIALLVYLITHKFSGKKINNQTISTTFQKDEKDDRHLPVGTILHDGLYAVESFIGKKNNLNLYQIRRTEPLYLCSQCNSELDNDTIAFCRVCGAALEVTLPTFPMYSLIESISAAQFSISEQLLAMNLKHKSLFLPVDVFSDDASGSLRYYLVEPSEQKPLLSETALPLPVHDVLEIGIQLADGMAYLHDYNVHLDSVSLDRIVYSQSNGYWLCFNNVKIPNVDEEFDSAVLSENVRDLVYILKTLMMQDPTQEKHVAIPDEIAELISHYLNAEMEVTAANLVLSLRQANRMLGGHNKVHYSIGVKSDVGRMRKLNEDSVLVENLTQIYDPIGLSVVIAGVADGVGGHAAGDVASQTTVAAIQTHIDTLRESTARIPETRDWLLKAANAANEAVYTERTKAGNNMACTLVLTLCVGDLATILNVGDSRAYHLNERGIRQITTDHSLVERLVAIGEITREEARHHPRKSVIYRVIGDRLNLDCDIYEYAFMPGEALLMCSDGVTDMVEDATIWRIWRSTLSAQEAAEKLVEEANTAGGTDNISVIIIEISE